MRASVPPLESVGVRYWLHNYNSRVRVPGLRTRGSRPHLAGSTSPPFHRIQSSGDWLPPRRNASASHRKSAQRFFGPARKRAQDIFTGSGSRADEVRVWYIWQYVGSVCLSPLGIAVATHVQGRPDLLIGARTPRVMLLKQVHQLMCGLRTVKQVRRRRSRFKIDSTS